MTLLNPHVCSRSTSYVSDDLGKKFIQKLIVNLFQNTILYVIINVKQDLSVV